VSPPVSAPSLAVTTDRSQTPTFHARTATSLLRYVGPAAAVPPQLPPVIGGSQLDALSPLGEAVVAPARDEVVLEVGESVTVPHALTTPRRLTPLDLYVLVDTSESMADDLDTVRRDLEGLVAGLRARGLDLSVGLGEFKGGESSVAYRRVVGVGPSTRAFTAGLDTLVADGFGLEAQLIALEQALDGRGETAADLLPAECKLTDPDPDRFVTEERRTAPPVVGGQAADFRRGSVPVVLMVTDTNFLRPAGTPLKPDCSVDVESVASAYSRAGVHVVGLGVDDVDNAPRAADMTQLAVATGALQPPGQACAPTISTRPGGPAVCRRAVDLIPTLERLAGAKRELVDLEVVESSGSRVVARVASRVSPVDLRSQQTVALPITYSCVDVEAGDYAADVEVRLAGVMLTEVLATVTCTAPAPLLPPVVAVALPPVVGLLPPPAPVPPPPPPAQVVQPQVQTQPQANPQVQSGVQEDQQEQVDLALALQTGPRPDEQPEFAMSARAPVVPAPAFALVVAAMASGAAGLQLRRQRREREALLGRLVTAR
jgi:Integrin beta chain VWA domain